MRVRDSGSARRWHALRAVLGPLMAAGGWQHFVDRRGQKLLSHVLDALLQRGEPHRDGTVERASLTTSSAAMTSVVGTVSGSRSRNACQIS